MLTMADQTYYKVVRKEHLNSKDDPTLHGGRLAFWLDEQGAAVASKWLDLSGAEVSTVGLYIGYLRPVRENQILELAHSIVHIGHTTLTIKSIGRIIPEEQRGRPVSNSYISLAAVREGRPISVDNILVDHCRQRIPELQEEAEWEKVIELKRIWRMLH